MYRALYIMKLQILPEQDQGYREQPFGEISKCVYICIYTLVFREFRIC